MPLTYPPRTALNAESQRRQGAEKGASRQICNRGARRSGPSQIANPMGALLGMKKAEIDQYTGVTVVGPLHLLTGGDTMITIKAVYDRGNVQFLEPTPSIERALVAVVFLDPSPPEELWPWLRETDRCSHWGEPMDDEGAGELLAIHDQLTPYRAEAEEAYLGREEG